VRLKHCLNFHDFRRLAKKRLPGPIFNYIDGAADDEVTYRRNTAAFDTCDLVPNVLRGVTEVDLSVTVMGQKLAMPVYCSPTALQRLFHHQGERAVAAAAARFGTMFGVSSLGTTSLEEARRISTTPQAYQFYFHKDRDLNREMMTRAKKAGVEVMMLTVDSITGGNRERDKRTGKLPQLDGHVDIGRGTMSISRYFTDMLDPSLSWQDVAQMVEEWGGQFCLKGVMAVEDAKRAVEIGCTGIVLSNHGGRQLDGSRTAFEQLAEVVDAVGDRIDVIMDGGVQRGSHVLKALSLGAKAVGLGRYYLFPLAVAGQAGVEHALELMRSELERDMKLMGCTSIDQLSRANIRFR
jgi:L-lactate dehydrogenase (cytochrome)